MPLVFHPARGQDQRVTLVGNLKGLSMLDQNKFRPMIRSGEVKIAIEPRRAWMIRGRARPPLGQRRSESSNLAVPRLEDP